ncbi:MAG: GNAT family N-acetyltransferase, partial [Treponema sp.]|nr:GNAT family N-acetyltransferase [Treponema sp.]
MEIKRYDVLTSDQMDRIHELYNNSFDLLKVSKEKFVKRLLENGFTKVYFLAELENRIIGYLIIVDNSIVLLIVDEADRNKGIGSNLLSKGEQEIK